MRIFICVDMEGVAGVATLANAAIQGAFDGGATDVVVADSHGTMDDLLVAAVDPRARIVLSRRLQRARVPLRSCGAS